jgi:DNA-binding NarL/FixJ family response regulator
MSIRLLIADDHVIVRTGLKSLLRGTDIKIVDEAATSEHALRLAEKHNPDVILLDVRMPENDGLWALAMLKSDRPNQPVLMWSAFDNPAFAARAVALGANGYILKSATRDELVKAICTAAAGDTTWTRIELQRAAKSFATPRQMTNLETPLTVRESEVLKELARGATNKRIAELLDISLATVKEHLQQIFRKLGVTGRTQAALWAVQHGLD